MTRVEIRTGLGWDVHRLAAGRPLILGGVTIAPRSVSKATPTPTFFPTP